MVVALVKQAREQKTEERRQEQRQEKVAKQHRSDQERRQREQDRADKEARRKHRDKEKEFGKLVKLPIADQEPRLEALAKLFGEELAVLREEFEAYTGGTPIGDLQPAPTPPSTWIVTPWDEPVDVAQLLHDLDAQFAKYIAIDARYRTTVVLWTAMSWVHDEIATHSPLLEIASMDEGCGKTEMEGVLAHVTVRPCPGAEFTGPNVYRTADRDRPTIILDNAEDLFQRRSDLTNIFNASWTRSTAKIPRQVKINGEYQTHCFNVFCPKIISHIIVPGKPMPRTIVSRGIRAKMFPKRPDEHVEEFMHRDDDDFAPLRRKLLRFAKDQANAIDKIKPTFPAGFNNRLQAN